MPCLGRNPLFTKQQKQDHEVKLGNLLWINFRHLRRIDFDFSIQQREKTAGKDLVRCSLKRNPQLSLRQPEGERISNVVVSGITTVQKNSGKINAKKGQKQVGIAISAERGQTTIFL
ncbi:hypothetical protein JTB14_016927 [Gonioctena quinquepunctata]|nr:hypothetical protein JTB14_016927 [Gonioctena quinquepunctata]